MNLFIAATAAVGLLLVVVPPILGNRAPASAKGWSVSLGLVVVTIGPIVCWALSEPHTLQKGHLDALGHPVDVAIAICVGYLTLDRFRARSRAMTLAETYRKGVPIERLLEKYKEDRCNTEELTLLSLFYLASDEKVQAAFTTGNGKTRDNLFFQSTPGRVLRLLIKGIVDRKIAIILLLMLCSWQLVSATVEIHDGWAQLVTEQLVWSALAVVILGYVVPAFSWLAAEWAFSNVQRTADHWKILESHNMVAELGELNIPKLKPKE